MKSSIASKQELTNYGGFFDKESKLANLAQIEQVVASADFWNDQKTAQKLLQQRHRLESAIRKADFLEKTVADLEVLFEFAAEDPTSMDELVTTLRQLRSAVEEGEIEMLFTGQHDIANAIVDINPGAGGTDAQDWAEMLLRMYIKWAERRGFKVEIVDEQPGKEAGIKSATFTIAGDYAYGYMKSEIGVHRLVRLSPFNSGQSRETSFASVYAVPEVDDDFEIEILDKDIRIDTYRSSGAGGQHVNVTDSAVRITHLPTGIVVSCQNQRSQHQNREMAFKILRSRLYELEMQKRREELAKAEAAKMDISFGSQIRNYVLHPYRLVKDTRTKLETSDIDAVLDGRIDMFMKEYLLQQSRKTLSE